jgi:hypothetical protein
MKARIIISFFLLLVIINPANSQQKSKQQLREEESLRKQTAVENLINDKNFVFVARWAYPLGGSQIDLISNPNYIKFNPDLFDGFMPFFGEGYAGIGYGGEGGIKFKDKPVNYEIVKNKKDYLVKASVQGENDIYKLTLTVTFEGRADLSIFSNNRSSIRYSGDIISPEEHLR